MSRTGFQQNNYTSFLKTIQGQLTQIRNSINSISTVLPQLAANQQRLVAGMTTPDASFGTPDQPDLDQLAGWMATQNTPLPAGTTFIQAVALFLQTNIGV
jgi:hypothetical protein